VVPKGEGSKAIRKCFGGVGKEGSWTFGKKRLKDH